MIDVFTIFIISVIVYTGYEIVGKHKALNADKEHKPKTEIVIKEDNNAEEELVNLVKKIKK